jgi:hypothetical protein
MTESKKKSPTRRAARRMRLRQAIKPRLGRKPGPPLDDDGPPWKTIRLYIARLLDQGHSADAT